MLDTDVAQTLALVNIARQAFGKDMLTELPDSAPGNASDCLFYRGLADIGCRSVDGRGNMRFKDARQAQYVASLWGARADGEMVITAGAGVGGFSRVINKFDTTQLPHYNTSESRDF